MTRRQDTSAHAQTTPSVTLNGVPVDPETVGLAPDRSRNYPTMKTGLPAQEVLDGFRKAFAAQTRNARLIRPGESELAPIRSRNHPVAATLGLRPRSAPVVRTLRDRFVAWRGAHAKARLERQYGEYSDAS